MSAFEKVIGFTKEKKELQQALDMIRDPEKYEKLGAKLPQGVLISGRPGIGKTLLAKSFIEESGLPAFTLRGNKGTDKFVDEITETFRTAKEKAPAIVFLDDMDKFSNSDMECRDTKEYVAVQAGIDEVKGAGVFVIATVNDEDKLPESLTRAGRFDICLHMNRPGRKDAEAIIRYYMSTKAVSPKVNLSDVGKMMSYYSCAGLESTINDAAIHAAFEGREQIEMEDLIYVVLKEEYGINEEDFSNTDEEELRKTALHEAGHLVMSDILVPGSVGLAMLDPNENGLVSGAVHRCEDFKRRPYHILVSLAGKVATEMEFCETVASGSHSDLEKAFNEIRTAISESGTAGLGMVDMATHRFQSNSDSFIDRNEAVTLDEMERYMMKARDILLKNREYLMKVWDELAEKKVLLNSDVKRIRESVPVTEVTV